MSQQETAQLISAKLKNRPKRASLIDTNIYKKGGKLAAQREAFKHQQTKDALNSKLQARPERSQYVQNAQAPALQAVARKLERNIITNNLTHALEDRAPVEEVRSHMKATNVAPSLRSAKLKLQNQFTKDKVGHLIETRTSKAALESAGIIQGDAVAPSLQGVQKKLARRMTVDKLGHLLEQRHEMSELQEQGVLQDANKVAPSIQGIQSTLGKNLARSNLYHGLKYRQPLSDLVEKGVYVPVDADYGAPASAADENYTFEDEEYGESSYDEEEEAAAAAQEQPLDSKYAAEEEEQAPANAQYARRSRNFHLTRILLKFVSILSQNGDISIAQKGALKDLIVDQDENVLTAAALYDQENDIAVFHQRLLSLI